MKLRDNSNPHNSLYHSSLRWARATDSLYPFDPDFLQSLNQWVKRVDALIKRYDGRWPHADSNLTSEDLLTPIDLTAGEQQYPLTYPIVARVRILEDDGVTWRTLTHRTRANLTDDELSSADVRYWYTLGGYLWLAGKTTYSRTNGIEIQYQLGPYTFVPADTAKEVGFDPLFEEIAILGPALDYLDINGPEEQAAKVRNRIGQEPINNVQGTGLLGALATAYAERIDDVPEIELERSNRALGLQVDSISSDTNPVW